MDKYIIISFQKEYLVFSMTNSLPSPEKVTNSNKLYHNKYIYTFKHFINKNNNVNIINLVNQVLLKSKINKLYIEDYRLIELSLKFIKLLKIEYFYSKNFKSFSINECNLIINNKNLTYVNAFYIPEVYLKKMLSLRKRININYRDSITDEFMISQEAIDVDSLYYKKVIHLDKKYEYKEKDLIEFLKINVYLKVIHLHNPNKKLLESIIEVLKKQDLKEISILLYQDNTEFIESNFMYLKSLNKKYKKELDGDIKIIYSKNYIKNNLFKQLTYNNIKIVLAIILYVLFVGLFFTELYNYSSKVNIDRLNYEMYINSLSETMSSAEEEPLTKEVIDKYKFDRSFENLKAINKDTVGWLRVGNTAVNYPVVQTTNNDYYLKRDFYKSKTSNGWIFMDYRNDSVDLNDNTVIYGHNLKSGLMFGTLSKALDSSWHTNSENLIIEFDSLSMPMRWKIFSVYKTEYTTDYLVTDFLNKEGYNEFVSMIKERSVYDFKEELIYGDKILTLSTCIGASSKNQRFVVHAKLIK